MTKEEVLAMGAGGKLDRLIEQEIMGGSALVERILPYHYSTNFSAAGQVVEKLNSDGYELHAYSGKEHSGAGFVKSLRWYVRAEGVMRMPEAICKAALMTKLEPENV